MKVKIWDFVILVEGLFIKVTLEPIKVAKQMIEKNPMLREEDATGLLINFIPHLKRWCPDPDEEELYEEEEQMGYRTYMQ